MTETEKKVSLRSALQAHRRALKLIYAHDPQMVISHFSSIVFNALTPYVGIFLSALVIDELVGNRDVKKLQLLVMVALISAAAHNSPSGHGHTESSLKTSDPHAHSRSSLWTGKDTPSAGGNAA